MAKPTLSEISKLFKTDDKPTDFHYYGTVVSADVENRTYEVSINRDENITVEAARLVGAHVGDTVMVTVMANGYATVTGRVGGDTDASDAQRKADGASDIADKARAKAVSALSKATAAEQLANQAEQNARRSADAAELAEENAGKSADYASESKTASEQAQQAAELAQQNAADSQTAAETAQQNAADSQTAAEAARDRAAVAEGYADTAQKQAAKAEKEASTANSYAVGALNSLSTTQDIIGVLSWVEESIKYVWDYPPTVEDKEYDPSKQYYTVIGKRVIDPIETDYDKYYVLNSESEPASKTGNIVTFDSDLDNFPLKSLTATINPKQDLHGYDKPWIGGAGKNKLHVTATTKTSASVTMTVNSDGTVSLSGTANALFNEVLGTIELTAGTTYHLSGCPSGGGNSTYDLRVRDGNYAVIVQDDGSGNSFTPTTSGTYYVAVVVRSGVNVSSKIVKPMICLESATNPNTFVPYSNICPISGWDEVKTYVSPTISAEDGTTYTTDLPETVYGGSLDVVNGVLTIDKAMVDLGTLNWAYRASPGIFQASLDFSYATDNAIESISSVYPFRRVATSGAQANVDGTFSLYTGNTLLWICDKAYTDATAFKESLSEQTAVLPLAEPRTIQLTPKQVNTLLGENNVWSDSGDVTVEYWDGPVGYVTPTSSFDTTETYYTVKGSPVKIDESKQEDHGKGLYYVHDLTNAKEAMADFIKAHLALTGEGLYVLKGDNDWRVLVANDGVYIIDPQGRRVASYKDSITLGTSEGNSIRITSEAITFNIGDKTFAYVAQDKWFASNAEVSGAMYIGDYSLRQKSNGDFVLGRRR